jgi:hypothetical protein
MAICRTEVVRYEGDVNIYDGVMMMVYSMMLTGLAYIDYDTKIGINISEIDVPYSKEQPCRMDITLTC